MKAFKFAYAFAAVILLSIVANTLLFGSFQNTAAAISESSNTPNTNLLQYEWPQLQGDSSFSRFSPGPAPEAPDVLWKTNIEGIQSYVSAFDGMVFAMTKTSIFALDRESGTILWSRVVPDPGPWPAVYKIDDGHLVVGNSCLDPQNGHLLWTSSIFSASPNPLFTNNVYVPEEKMFYTKVDSYVQAWNFSNPAASPNLTWKKYISGSGTVGSGIQYGDGKVFPGSFESHQVALDAKTGDVVWDVNTKAAMLFSGTYYDDRFFRGGTHDNTIYAFNATSGEILWTYNPGSDDGYFCSGTAAAYGMVYALNKDGGLYALDVVTGDVVWRYQGPGTLIFPGNPTVGDGKVYATTGQSVSYGNETGASEFACLDAYTGTIIWKLPIEAFAPRESVALAYGNLYLIPGYVTTMVDSESGDEYSTDNQIWAIGTKSWPMFRNDPTHKATGQSGPMNLTLRWKFQTGGAVVSSPSIADEIAYFGSQDKNIYAVDARDGSLYWKFATQERIWSSPAVANGKVYTGTDDGNVYCLDAYNGTKIWEVRIGTTTPSKLTATVQLRSSPMVSKGIVYVGSQNGNLYALNEETGNITWTYSAKGPITASPALADGSVYFTAQEPASGTLYKVDATNGTLYWKKTIPYLLGFMGGTDMQASPTIASGMVYISANAEEYYGISTKDGTTVWTYSDPSAEEFILCSPVFDNGRLFLIDKFSIVCVNAYNGSKIWSSYLGDELYISPSYADNKLYMVTDQRHIYVLNAVDGSKMSVFTTDSNSWSAPTIYEGRLYAGNNDWNVYCLANYPTLASTITLNLDKSQVNSEELLTGFGQLRPGLENTIVLVDLTKPDGANMRIQTKTTTAGYFTFTLNPTIEGNWTFVAHWVSDRSYYTSSSSQNLSVLVNPIPTPTPLETPTPSPTPTATPIPTPTPTPFEKQTLWGVPLPYVYMVVISGLVAIIGVAGYLLRRRPSA